MRGMMRTVSGLLLLAALSACAGGGSAGAGASRMEGATATRLANEGAIADRNAAAGEPGGAVTSTAAP